MFNWLNTLSLKSSARKGGDAGARAACELARQRPTDVGLVQFFISEVNQGICLTGLEQMRHPAASRYLLKYFSSNTLDLDSAVRALSHPWHAFVVPDLLSVALTHDDPHVVGKALRVLGNIGTPEARDAIGRYVASPERNLKHVEYSEGKPYETRWPKESILSAYNLSAYNIRTRSTY